MCSLLHQLIALDGGCKDQSQDGKGGLDSLRMFEVGRPSVEERCRTSLPGHSCSRPLPMELLESLPGRLEPEGCHQGVIVSVMVFFFFCIL